MKTYNIPQHLIDKILDSPAVDLDTRHELMSITRKGKLTKSHNAKPSRATKLSRIAEQNGEATRLNISMGGFVVR